MTAEPRHADEYGSRQVEAARRVLVDLGQVLGSYVDSLVLVGGWTPSLLLPGMEEPHVGSTDVDLVLDADKLNDGRYADLLKLLLETRRYERGGKPFQFVTKVPLSDGEPPVQVEVEFLAPLNAKLRHRKSKLLEEFRVLQVHGAEVAFRAPVNVKISGKNILGADNEVRLLVVSVPDFLVLKSLAIDGRDKPKDAYDLCYCLEYCADIDAIAEDWRNRPEDKDVLKAIEVLQNKFSSPNAFGPQQLVEFHNPNSKEEAEGRARRAYELVQRFLDLVKRA